MLIQNTIVSPRRVEVVVCVGGITLLGAVLRFANLGFKSLWLDEAVTYWAAAGDLLSVLRETALGTSGGPLFNVALWLVVPFSSSEEALRLLPCLAGIAAIPVTYLLCRLLVSSRAVYLAPLLVAVSPNQIRYSQQVREYSLAFLFGVLLLWAFLSWLRSDDARRWLCVTGLMCLSIALQYGLGLLIAALNLVVVVLALRKEVSGRLLMRWVAAQGIVGVSVAVVYHLILRHQLRVTKAAYLAHGYWDGSLRGFAQLLVGNTWEIFEFAFPAAALVCVLVAVALLRTERAGGERVWALLLVLPFVVSFAAGILGFHPYLGDRQAMYLLPMVYIAAATGIDRVSRYRWGKITAASVTVFLLTSGLLHTKSYLESTSPEHLRPVVKELLELASESDIAYVHAAATPAFRYYIRRHTMTWEGGEPVWPPSGVFEAEMPDQSLRWLMTHEGVDAAVEMLAGEEHRTWLIFSHIRKDQLDEVLAQLEVLGLPKLVRKEPGAWLYVIDTAAGESVH